MKISSRTDYLQRIDRVVAAISESIERGGQTPSVARLAELAHFSEFHFMRVYRALSGEPLGETTQRLRLQRAVHLLKETDATVTQIAASVGYETPQAFAKAFRQRFSAAPSDVRERPEAYATAPPHRFGTSENPPVVCVEVVQLQPFRAAVLRNHGAYADLDQAYIRLFGWMVERGALESIQGIWGIPYDDRRDAAPERSVFDCCLATDAELVSADGIRLEQLGGGRYAMYRHVGSYLALDDVHDALLRDALPQAALTLRDAPILHRFINEPDVTPEAELETHIYIPVE